MLNRDQLLDSAMYFADRALKAYIEEDNRVILTNAAISLEHLCKAYLCDMSPALLMEIKNGQLDSLLHLTGHSARAKDPTKAPRTISGRVAIERVQDVLRGIKVPKDQIKQLIDVRDNVVHVGYLDGTEIRETLTAALRLNDELYQALTVAKDDRWGRHRDLVESLISKSLNEVQRSVKQRMAAAQLKIEEMLAKIPDSERKSVMDARQARVTVALAGEQECVEAECPVCKHPGAYCIGLPDYEADLDVEPNGMGGYEAIAQSVIRYLAAQMFYCGVCELDLVNPDELEAAGLETKVDLPQEDDDGFFDEGPWTVD